MTKVGEVIGTTAGEMLDHTFWVPFGAEVAHKFSMAELERVSVLCYGFGGSLALLGHFLTILQQARKVYEEGYGGGRENRVHGGRPRDSHAGRHSRQGAATTPVGGPLAL